MDQIITIKQRIILKKIYDLYQAKGVSPILEELRAILNYSKISSVQRHIDALKTKKLLQSDKHKPRTMHLTNAGQKAIGKSLTEVKFNDTFPACQTTLPLTILLEKASVPTNSSSIAYKNSTLKANGTTTSNVESVNTKIISGSKSSQPNLFDGTSKKYQSLISIQNSTINFPFNSLDFTNIKDFFTNNDYLVIVAVSFTLIRIFNEGFLWFVVLLVSLFLTRKINKYL